MSASGGGDLSELITKLNAFLATSVVAGGTTIYLKDDPIAFVQAVIITRFSEWVLTGAATLAIKLRGIFDLFVRITVDGGREALEPFGIAGVAFVDILTDLNGLVVGLASTTGLFSPIVAILLWGAIFVAAAKLIQGLLVAVKWVT